MRFFIKILFALMFTAINIVTFAQQPSFSEYKVSLFKGRPARLIIKDNPLAKMYKTIITDTYHNKVAISKWHGPGGLNFAGHYCFVYWGCGSDCQHGAIVDLQTGKIYDAPTAARLFSYEPWSRLLILNRAKGNDSCAFCKPEYWVLSEKTKQFVKLQ